MLLVLIILYSTHTRVSSLSLRELSEITILPEIPQLWNCKFFPRVSPCCASTPASYWGLPISEILLSMPKIKKLHNYQGKERLSLTQQEAWGLSVYTHRDMLSLASWFEPYPPYFLIQNIPTSVETCVPTFLSMSAIYLDIWMPVAVLRLLACSLWFMTSPSDPFVVFQIHRIYRPVVL